MYVSFPPGRGSTLPAPSSLQDLTPGVKKEAVDEEGKRQGGGGGGGSESLATHKAGELEALAIDIQELKNSIFHLNRSNNELREALKETPDDSDFKAAIVENVDVIASRLEKLKELQRLYNEMSGLSAAAGSASLGSLPASQQQAESTASVLATTAATPVVPSASSVGEMDASGGLML